MMMSTVVLGIDADRDQHADYDCADEYKYLFEASRKSSVCYFSKINQPIGSHMILCFDYNSKIADWRGPLLKKNKRKPTSVGLGGHLRISCVAWWDPSRSSPPG